MSNTTELLVQLNSLLRLTNTEIMIAETRRAQAATADVERELAANADMGRERMRMLTEAIRELGAVPDVVGVAAGRLSASAKAAVEQGQDMTEAILGDLALEHQLLDRTRLASMIAQHLELRAVRRTLERLERAHTATIQWLMTRLAEIAEGNPPALRPTPMQSVAGFGRRLGTMPSRSVATAVNRSIDGAERVRRQTVETVRTNADRVRELAGAAADIWSAGRDASLKRTEEIADAQGDRDTARAVNRRRRDLGAVDGSELPIRRYDELTVETVTARIARMTDAEQVRTILAYESAHKARKGVVDATRNRLEQLSQALAAAS